ncbi:MAG: Mov34/MPN/PAD-1 family protein [Erythrobacter sp.]
MPFWTYMLHCNAGVLYTGQTDNLEHRIADHKAGRFAGFSKNYLPVELVWSQEFATREEAKSAEKRIKGWSRGKKLALIRGDWSEISRLAKSKNSPSTSSGRADIFITASGIEALTTQSTAAHPNECCGLLLGSHNAITAIQPTANVHPSPQSHFEIDPQALIDAHRKARAGGPAIIGYYHSHPTGDPHPSATDRAMAAHDGTVWAIIAGSGAEFRVTFWRDDKDGFHPLSYAVGSG